MPPSTDGIKSRAAHDTLIFVRPPPSNFHNALSLQVQLVPPNERAGIIPPDADPDGAGPMGFASSTSLASTSSSRSRRRKIVPLLNLQIRSGTVSDASTDKPVAKFQKRWLDVHRLAVLEPIEVWVSPDETPSRLRSCPSSPAMSGCGSESMLPLYRSAEASYSSEHGFQQLTDFPTEHKKKRGIFSRIFHHKSPGSHTYSELPRQTVIRSLRFAETLALPSFGGTKRESRSSMNITVVPPSPTSPTAPSSSPCLPQIKVLGMQAAVTVVPVSRALGSYADLPSGLTRGRPQVRKYIFTVRQWIKKDSQPQGHSAPKLLGMSLPSRSRERLASAHHDQSISRETLEAVDVSFEWKRGKARAMREQAQAAKRQALLGRHHTPSHLSQLSGSSVATSSETHSTLEDSPGATSPYTKYSCHSPLGSDDTDTTIGSPAPRSVSPPRPPVYEDDGEDSDSEDSDTPWICTIKVRRPIGPSSSCTSLTGSSLSASRPDTSRLHTGSEPYTPSRESPLSYKLGTLTPTPHHPKLVAMLKTPTTLPDVAVESMSLRHGDAQLPSGMEKPDGLDDPELVLTSEDLRKVMCTTGVWLAFRENMGSIRREGKAGER
ncbi:hypothetical protein HGRIS_001967 [Hohenbuehelia grisea]|uniref:Uncharacterized protein n=1 Tax=Hohenbuehelia grisea TaxID=104357 RepID=A0ABR3JJ69_9AGAR